MVQNFALASLLVMFTAASALAGAEHKGADHNKAGTTATEASATTTTGGDAGKGAEKAGSADDKTVTAATPEAPKDGAPAAK